jgi:hypothetical protein
MCCKAFGFFLLLLRRRKPESDFRDRDADWRRRAQNAPPTSQVPPLMPSPRKRPAPDPKRREQELAARKAKEEKEFQEKLAKMPTPEREKMLARQRKFMGGANAVVKPEPGKKIKLPVKAPKNAAEDSAEDEVDDGVELGLELEEEGPVIRTVSTGEHCLTNKFEVTVKPQFMYSSIKVLLIYVLFFLTYYSKYVLEFDIRTSLKVLKFDIRTLLNVLEVHISNLSTLSR